MATQQLKQAFLVLLAVSSLVAIPARADDAESQVKNGMSLLDEALESNDSQKLEQAAKIFQAQLDKPGFDHCISKERSTRSVFVENSSPSAKRKSWHSNT